MGRLGGNPKLFNLGGTTMRKVLSAACLGAMATFAVGAAYANEAVSYTHLTLPTKRIV